MWDTYRKNRILADHELLRIMRPDISTIKYIRRTVWFLTTVVVIALATFNFRQVLSLWFFYAPLICCIIIVVFMVLHIAINTHPIIFTEAGVFQKWCRALLWEDIEGYIWMPFWGKDYLMLRFTPSNSMPIYMQINSIKGGFGMIHSNSKKNIEELLSSKGIKYENI